MDTGTLCSDSPYSRSPFPTQCLMLLNKDLQETWDSSPLSPASTLLGLFLGDTLPEDELRMS